MSGSFHRVRGDGGKSPVSIATRLSSGGLSDIVDDAYDASPAGAHSKVHRPVPISWSATPVALSRDEKLAAYRRLPMATTLPRCLLKTHVYLTLRSFSYDGSPLQHAPQVCVVINPHSRFTHACFPLVGLGINCDEIYPRVAETFYDSFLDFDTKSKYRPDLIMVDDPLLHTFFRRELHGSGTQIRLVIAENEPMDDPLWQRDAGDEGTSLSRICAEVFPEVRAATAQYVREHADAFPCKLSASAAAEPFFESTAPGEDAFAGGGSDGAGTAVVLRACCYCGVLAPRIKRCSGCWPRKQTNICSSDCFLRYWQAGHRRECDEKAWPAVSLI